MPIEQMGRTAMVARASWNVAALGMRTLPVPIPWTWTDAMARSLLTLLVMLLSTATGQAQRTPANKPLEGSWVKLCETNKVKGKDKDEDGKEVTKDVDTCVTLTEQIHPENGMVMVSAKYHQIKIDGQEKQSFQLTVPLGVVLPAGLGITVFPKNLWDKLLKSEKLEKADEEKLKAATIPLTYTFCKHARLQRRDRGQCGSSQQAEGQRGLCRAVGAYAIRAGGAASLSVRLLEGAGGTGDGYERIRSGA